MHSLETLLKRLEAVTSRLEDIAENAEATGKFSTLDLLNPVSHSAGSLTTSRGLGPASQVGSDNKDFGPLPTSVEKFDEFLEKTVGRYIMLSNELGGSVAKQAACVLASFQEQRKIFLIASRTPKPDAAGRKKIFQPMNNAAAQVVQIQEAGRTDEFYNHLSSVADGISLLGWIHLETRPYRHVDGLLGSAQYFGNKVLSEFKESDVRHVEWVRSFYQIFPDLSDLIREYFPLGVEWST
ncbi:adenylate cyclase-associated CAP [Thozetella sp. PMI_491]|nr:adenylate cyclase-associated CAP [Thozetella sp. PMI_491]